MNDRYEVTKEFRFEACHSLSHLPDGHKCRNMHGHSYVFVINCRGQLDDRAFVVDYYDIGVVGKYLVDLFDHQNLNEILPCYTTAENLAKFIYDYCLENPTLKYTIHSITVKETASTTVTYPVSRLS